MTRLFTPKFYSHKEASVVWRRLETDPFLRNPPVLDALLPTVFCLPWGRNTRPIAAHVIGSAVAGEGICTRPMRRGGRSSPAIKFYPYKKSTQMVSWLETNVFRRKTPAPFNH